MKRGAAVLLAIGALFAAVALLKNDAEPTAGGSDSASVSAVEKDRVRRFWDVYRRATEHRVAGRYAEAAAEYDSALALDPGHHDALYYQGNVQLDLGNFSIAERAWRQLIQLEPTSSRAHSQLGTLYFCVGEDVTLRPERAAAEFHRAAEINREETGPLLSLGEIALVQEDLDDARSYFDAVIGSNYTSVEAHFYQGYIAWKSGNTAQASELLAEAASLARPPAPAEGVPGEGDTEAGAAPMVREPARCGVMRARIDEMVMVDAALAGDTDAVYPAFDDLLRDVRVNLPR